MGFNFYYEIFFLTGRRVIPSPDKQFAELERELQIYLSRISQRNKVTMLIVGKVHIMHNESA